MSAELAAAQGRQAAEDLMIDACDIVRYGEPVLNVETGQNERSEQVIYQGKCRVRPAGAQREAEVGVTHLEMLQHQVSIPFSVTAVRAHDHVRITECVDASFIGLELTVRGIARGTHITARRLWCEEATP